MSTATAKRPYAQALADAQAFRDLFPAQCYERWEIAGSIRRGKAEAGDVEHVVIPAFGDIPGDGLFGQTERVNLLWHHLDAMMKSNGAGLAKHVYGTTENGGPLYRWGEKYRGIDFRGFNNEIFCATPDTWGAVLLIRTGPADYSRRVVTVLKDRGVYRQQEGQLVSVTSGQPVAVPDEQTYLRLAGLSWTEPRARS